MTKPKKLKKTYVFRHAPSPCNVLAIDPGKVTGWAIWRRGFLLASGIFAPFDLEPLDMLAVFKRFAAMPGDRVVALEKPFRGQGNNATTVGSAYQLLGVRCANFRLRKVVRVYPGTWRTHVLRTAWEHSTPYHKAKRETLKAEEVRVSSLIKGVSSTHPDEAAAILIGQWGSYAGQVFEQLPKKVREA